MNRNILIGIVFLLILLGIGGYLANNYLSSTGSTNTTFNPTTNPSNQPSVSVTPTNESTPESEANSIKSFTITGNNFKFDTSTLRVNQGDTVKITFKNQTGIHDLKVTGYNVGTKQIAGGQEETIEFITDKTGTFEYYCSASNHRQLGMKGTLIVE